jgi:chromosome segregation ATPase
MDCEWCGKTIEKAFVRDARYFCGVGCANHFDTQQKYGNKKGILAGLGQAADGMALGDSGGMSADHMIGGAAKVSGGLVLGAAGLAIAGVGKLAKFGVQTVREMKEEAARERERIRIETINQINSITFDDIDATEKGVASLFKVFNSIFSGDAYNLEIGIKKELADVVLQKLIDGVHILRNDSHYDIKKLEKLQARLQKARIKRLEITSFGEDIGNMFTNRSAFNQIMAAVEGVYLDGSQKFIVKEVDSLFKAMNSFLGLTGKGVPLKLALKRELAGAGFEKIQTGITALQDSNLDANKISKYQKKFEGLKKKMAKLERAAEKNKKLTDDFKKEFTGTFTKAFAPAREAFTPAAKETFKATKDALKGSFSLFKPKK